MQDNNNPLSPHLQIYKWQISSLLSIAHRIVGVINIVAITLICFWTLLLLFGESSYEITKLFFLLNIQVNGITPDQLESILLIKFCSSPSFFL